MEKRLEERVEDKYNPLRELIFKFDEYYKPIPPKKPYEEEKPVIIWDYNLGRTTSVQGFFSELNKKAIVVGSTLSAEKTDFVKAHESEHWKRHRNNAPQEEYSVDIAAKKITGSDPYNRWGYSTAA